MKSRSWLHWRFVVIAATAVLLIAIHGIVLRYVSASLALPTVAALVVVALVLLKHVGMLGSLLAALRIKARTKPPRPDHGKSRQQT